MRCEDCEDYDWCVMVGERGHWCESMWKMKPIEPPLWRYWLSIAKWKLRLIREKILVWLHPDDYIPF